MQCGRSHAFRRFDRLGDSIRGPHQQRFSPVNRYARGIRSWPREPEQVLRPCQSVSCARTPVRSPSGVQVSASSSQSHLDATIFALSTAPGKAAIAVVRCSGPACAQIYNSLSPSKPFPQPRRAALRKLYSPTDSSLLDPGALILSFPAPSTVTGEDVLELHLHGGNATVRAVLAAISSVSSPSHPIRYAEPGEFTRRAFYNSRLDLTQIEALGDTLSAETEQQRRLAAQGSTRILAARYESWRQQLLFARGELEALIDFSEDQHFDESPAELAASVAEKVHVLVGRIDASLGNAARGELLRNGIKVALLGAPNVGKSSLLNRVVGREAAIVSSEAGTTRDVVEMNVDVGGFFCNFGDLAGLRGRVRTDVRQEGEIGQIEQEGMRRAKERALEADVVLVVRACEVNGSGELDIPLPAEVAETIRQCDLERQRIIHVINKVDLVEVDKQKSPESRQAAVRDHVLQNLRSGSGSAGFDACDAVLVSCEPSSDFETGTNCMQDLLQQLTATFESMTEAQGIPGITSTASTNEASLGASERQARLLEDCRQELGLFLETVGALVVDEDEVEADFDIVVAAEHLRGAADCLAKITGKGEAGDVEDVLGVVFENFCVGK